MTSNLAISDDYVDVSELRRSQNLAFETQDADLPLVWSNPIPNIMFGLGPQFAGRAFAPNMILIHIQSPGKPTWLGPTVEGLQNILALPDGWDSYGAPRIGGHVARRVLELLSRAAAANTPAPAVIPIAGGGLQLEWHARRVDVEIVILPDDRASLFMRCPSEPDGREWEGSLAIGLGHVVLLVRPWLEMLVS